MPWHPGAGAGCSEQRPGGTVALGYIHTYILGGRYRDAVIASTTGDGAGIDSMGGRVSNARAGGSPF